MRSRLSFLSLTLSLLFTPWAHAQTASKEGPTFALRAGRVITAAAQGQWGIENAVILVRDGKIAAVGRDVAIPSGITVIDLPDATVMPGLVAAAAAGPVSQGPESVRAAYRAADAVDRYADTRRTLAAGVTTMHISPGWNRLVAGRGAVVRLAGPPEQRILAADTDLTITLADSALNPPSITDYLVPPSSDNEIRPPRLQRPSSRMGQYLALREAVSDALNPGPVAKFDTHLASLADAWRANTPLRIQAQRGADLAGALTYLGAQKKAGYLVGGLEAARMSDQLAAAGFPLVYTIDAPFRSPGRNLGNDPDALAGDTRALAALARVRLALGVTPDQPAADLRLAAATALRAGLSPQRVIDAITRVPAEILGVAARVGSIEPGKDADLLVLTGDPLATATHVQRVYVLGRVAYDASMETPDAAPRAARASTPVVVRAGTIWLGPDNYLENGSVLIEDGVITQVGKSVSVPPAARVIDAGADAFVTPGFIDAFGHLGLDADTNPTGPDASLSRTVGAADLAELRVARAGVTTVMLAPYRASGSGSQVSAVKTAGATRAQRVVAPTAAVFFDVSDAEPLSVADRFRPRLEAGKKYAETWKKYHADLADWEKKRAEGKATEPTAPQAADETPAAPAKEDPITGTWQIRVFGGPTNDERTGKIQLKLTGSKFEGRIIELAVPVEAKIVGELDAKRITGRIEVESRGFGFPTFEGTISEPDKASGTISIPNVLTIQFEMRRIDKGDIEFKVQSSRKKKTTGKDGRPLPPRIDESLEPFRAAIEKRIPIVVAASGAARIDAVLDILADEYDLPLVLIDPDETNAHADRLVKKQVGIIGPADPMQRRDDRWVVPHDRMARLGLRVAFQSNAEDAARNLPSVALFAVERGLSAEKALAALTIDAASMFKLDSKIGRIAPGCAGDLVIFSGHPFQTSSTVRRVLVGGEEVTP
jgi:imidazolonepropionase-like amidohydrolase